MWANGRARLSREWTGPLASTEDCAQSAVRMLAQPFAQARPQTTQADTIGPAILAFIQMREASALPKLLVDSIAQGLAQSFALERLPVIKIGAIGKCKTARKSSS